MTSFTPQYIQYDNLASTNEELKRLLKQKQFKEGTVVITNYQNAGKGQAGNSWESEKDKNLTLSLLLRPHFIEPANQFYISKMVSLALIDTIREFLCGITIKWPNDIYIGDKKVAGILIENSIMGPHIDYCIVGIGLNVNQTEFVSDAPNPISLKQLGQFDYDLEKVKSSLIKHLQKRYKQLQEENEDEINKSYFGLLYRNIGKHPFKDEDGIFRASIKGVNELGMLTLKDDEGQYREYAFKELEFLKE